MPDPSGPPDSVGILVPSGMLGAGFSPETITRGLSLGADVIAVDGGSTDSGPYYLGTGTAKTTDSAVRRDLRLLLAAASRARIPLIVGSCGTSGTDSGVHWVAGIVTAICAEDGLDLTVAKICSEQRASELVAELERGRIHALPPSGPLDAATLRRCSHIVAMMGHEPIEQALRAGADVVLAGRATDTAVSAAFALIRGMPPGPTWHAAKIIECGGQCTTNPAAGGVFARIDHRGFTIEPLDEDAACTPASVAAHMLYETVNPYTMREPGGTIEVAGARYTALDERTVRVEGSRFEPAAQYTVKLEGAADSRSPPGTTYQTPALSWRRSGHCRRHDAVSTTGNCRPVRASWSGMRWRTTRRSAGPGSNPGQTTITPSSVTAARNYPLRSSQAPPSPSSRNASWTGPYGPTARVSPRAH